MGHICSGEAEPEFSCIDWKPWGEPVPRRLSLWEIRLQVNDSPGEGEFRAQRGKWSLPLLAEVARGKNG
jgi:hypothetical protein